MATQIASTPIIRGSEAHKILREAEKKPSSESKSGAKKLSDFFGKMLK